MTVKSRQEIYIHLLSNFPKIFYNDTNLTNPAIAYFLENKHVDFIIYYKMLNQNFSEKFKKNEVLYANKFINWLVAYIEYKFNVKATFEVTDSS